MAITFNLCKVESSNKGGVKIRIMGTPFRKDRVVTLESVGGAYVRRMGRIRARGLVDAFTPVENPAWSWEFWGKVNTYTRSYADWELRREGCHQKVWEVNFEFTSKERERPFMCREGEGEYCSILCFSKRELKRVINTLKPYLEPGYGSISCWSSHLARFLGLAD